MADVTDPGAERFPRVFGNYLLLHRLASGGMGSVYLARRDMSAIGGGIEKHCIVKTLKGSFTDDPEYIARFIDEARVVVQLSHRNICQVFDVGKVGARHYLAMEYVPGVDLKTLQERLAAAQRALPAQIALHLAIEALDALDYAHRHEDPATGKPLGLVHRDVSPQNVMVNYEGEVKLIDFGLAASQVKSETTQPNMVMGKLAYMAPEHARGDAVDGRSDLFALAIVLYELLSGARFYENMPTQAIWRIAGLGGYRPTGWTSLDPGLAAVLDRALANEPAQRFATCSAFRDALEEYAYAQGLRGGREKLRALMGDLFADARDTSRRLLSSFGSATSGEAGEAREPTEPTVTIAVSPALGAQPGATGKTAAAPGEPQRDKPTLTDVVPAARVVSRTAPTSPARERGRGTLLAAIAVVGVLAVAGAWLATSRAPDAAPVAPPAPAPLVAPAPIAPAPVAPATPPDAGTATVADPVVADAGVATPAPTPAPSPAPSSGPPRKPKRPRPGIDATDSEKLGYLAAECPRAKCVVDVRAQKKALDAIPILKRAPADTRRFKDELNRCVERCGR